MPKSLNNHSITYWNGTHFVKIKATPIPVSNTTIPSPSPSKPVEGSPTIINHNYGDVYNPSCQSNCYVNVSKTETPTATPTPTSEQTIQNPVKPIETKTIQTKVIRIKEVTPVHHSNPVDKTVQPTPPDTNVPYESQPNTPEVISTTDNTVFDPFWIVGSLIVVLITSMIWHKWKQNAESTISDNDAE